MKKITWLICFVFLFASAKAFAGVSMSMTPSHTVFQLKPGKKERQVIEIKNSGYKLLKLESLVSGFSQDNSGSLSYSSGPYTAEKWITIAPKELVVRPYDFGVVRFEVRVPDDPAPPPGSYTAAVIIRQAFDEAAKEQKEEKKTAETDIKIGAQFAHPVYIDVGKPTYSAKIESFEVKREKDKTVFVLGLRNTGVFDYPTTGVIKIESGGKKIQEIATRRATVARGKSRTITIDVPSKLAPGSYQAILSLNLNKDQKLEARTTFTLTSQ